MRRLFLSIAAVAALLMSGSFTHRAEAAGVGSAAGIPGAVEDLAVVEHVHCIPGVPHHVPTNWRRRDGCARGGVVVVPGRYWHHHHHRHHRHHHHHHHHRHRR